MKQYCRYCVWLCVNNFPYCQKKCIQLSESYCKHTNDCNEFVFADVEPGYQDAFGETSRGYKPRGQRHKQQIEGQMTLF